MARNTIIEVTYAARGAPGTSAYQIAVNNGFVGTEAEWLLSLRAPAVDPSDQPVFDADSKGLVPASGGGANKYLNADGQFTIPAGGGGGGVSSWNDLTDKPTLFSGSYEDLTDKPALFSGTWAAISGKPVFAAVATSGNYNDLSNRPVLFDGTWGSLAGKPLTFTPAAHTHLMSEITGLTAALLGKQDAGEYVLSANFNWANLVDKPATFPPATHNHDDRYYTEDEIDGMLASIGAGDLWLVGPTIATGNLQTITIPSATPVNDIAGYANGLYMEPTTDYTVSGTTITIQPGAFPAGQRLIFWNRGNGASSGQSAPVNTAPVVQSFTTTATATPAFGTDLLKITAQAGPLTVANATGIAVEQSLLLRIKDNGTARAITWGSKYRSLAATLPTTTVASKLMYVYFEYNADDDRWDCTGVGVQA